MRLPSTLCNGLGWIKGYEDGTFLPKQIVTRAEAAQMVLRFLESYFQ
ncbi:S-layer homology domain-containing protein [Niameybacter sp.]